MITSTFYPNGKPSSTIFFRFYLGIRGEIHFSPIRVGRKLKSGLIFGHNAHALISCNPNCQSDLLLLLQCSNQFVGIVKAIRFLGYLELGDASVLILPQSLSPPWVASHRPFDWGWGLWLRGAADLADSACASIWV